jgi:hypothetical protein
MLKFQVNISKIKFSTLERTKKHIQREREKAEILLFAFDQSPWKAVVKIL